VEPYGIVVLMIGRTISHYKVLSKLGEGGMGVVYKAEDLTLGRTVALKFLPPDSVAREDDRARLVHEARAAAALLHPNICPVYEIAEAEGRIFIAMACIEGRSLKDRIADGPLPLSEALSIARQIGEALSAAHSKGIIHRDIKPGNVMVLPDGRPVLMDFGLAKVAGTTKLTRTGTTMGTVAYMSPEQVHGQQADHRSDIWALGVVLYEMVSGKAPFGGEYEAALMYSILNEDPEPLSGEGKETPAGLDGIIAKALEKDPGKRYQRAEEFVADVAALAQDSQALPAGKARPARGLKRLWRQWRPWQRAAAVCAACAVAAAVIYGAVELLLPNAEAMDSIGFIPLQNLSGDAKGELWADGVTEWLTASMGMVPALKKIVSDQTMKQFKGSKEPASAIGRKVGAKALVGGSLMLIGDQVQITIMLVEASKDRQIWSNTFSGAAADIVVLQGQIVRAIAEKLKARLTPEGEGQLASAGPVNPEVYSEYLQGVRDNNDWLREEALEHFRRALRIDPEFAPAYAGMAVSYVNLALGYDMHPDQAAPLARSAAAQAAQLDQNSADAHLALAWVKLNFDWDWSAAESEFNRALEINPKDPFILSRYAFYLVMAGRPEESIPIARRMQEEGWGDLPWVYFYGRRYDDLIAFLATEQAKGAIICEWEGWLVYAYIFKGRSKEALAVCKTMEAMPGFSESQFCLAMAGYAYGALGRRDKALDVLDRLRELQTDLKTAGKYLDPYSLAFVFAGLGDKDQAFASLRESIEIRQPACIQMPIEPFFDNLHSDPRWQELLRVINYPGTR
jgi:TolB-like protein/predicted Ser/Thr protein kinase